MKWTDYRKILKRILECPTAPFHEYRVRDAILEMLAEMPHVSVDEDGFGNLLATFRRGRKRGRFAFGAHMDHPGWVRVGDAGAEKDEDWRFLGGVPADYLRDPVIADFGAFGMWDLPAMDVKDDLIHSRACDDLINCATIVALFEALEKGGAETTCHGIFTRAEEVGFVGAIEMAKAWPFASSVAFISLETSSPAGEVSMGQGPVLRVGDRISIFDDSLTREISQVAEAHGIAVQRSLLDRGSCEATAVQAYGIRCAGLSILLGNYHNCGPGGKIEAEYVSKGDALALVDLVEAMSVSRVPGSAKTLRRRLETRARGYSAEARATRRWFQDR